MVGAWMAIAVILGVVGLVPPPAQAAGCSNLFTPAFAQDLARRYGGVEVTAAVFDTRTGCWHRLNHGMQVTTASVVKAQVLGAVLLRAQGAGRGLTTWEQSQIGPMIQYSFNPETGALYQHVGSEAGMRASDPAFGVTATQHTATFGLTRSTAVDRTNVALRLLWGGGPLQQGAREEAWRYMANVHPLQEWGISAGVPAGWTVAQKNGFYPSSGLGWRVGSSGFVRQDVGDQGYAITVMTQRATSQRHGIQLVEEVARRAAAALTVGPGANRPIDRARCVSTSGGESLRAVAGRLGLPSSRAGEVRTTSGGNTSPLPGQQACSPDIPGPSVLSTSSVKGTYRVVASDLDCDGRDDLLWYAPGAAPDSRWAGQPDRRFASRSLSIGGDHIPVAGDFDGDGCGDVLWYGYGSRADVVWAGGTTVRSIPVTVAGLGYAPTSGDFDGDGRDDVLWYRPGSANDTIWYGRPTIGQFDSMTLSVAGAYEPVVADLDGDGADDVYWYARGPESDHLWRGQLGVRSFREAHPGRVDLAYRPVATDGDGDGIDEIVWYAPGSAADSRWTGLPSSGRAEPLVIDGDFVPVAGDFDGDGRGDIAWYGPGERADRMWWGRADGRIDSTALGRG